MADAIPPRAAFPQMRVYDADEIGKDGYPLEWHETIKHAVRAAAEHRCVRCHHPYRTGEHPMERVESPAGGHSYVSWSPCDERCAHGGPMRMLTPEGWQEVEPQFTHAQVWDAYPDFQIEARARILTVHHLDGNKANCRWWNLVSLCQRCHLQIQGRVHMARIWPWEHTDWFKPYVAGYYASVYLGEELERDDVMARLEELLDLERVA